MKMFFIINGKTISALTNSYGIAKFKITEIQGTYIVTTKYNNQTYYNKVIVKSKHSKNNGTIKPKKPKSDGKGRLNKNRVDVKY